MNLLEENLELRRQLRSRDAEISRLKDAHAARESALVLEVEERRKVDLENCKRIDALVAQLESANAKVREFENAYQALEVTVRESEAEKQRAYAASQRAYLERDEAREQRTEWSLALNGPDGFRQKNAALAAQAACLSRERDEARAANQALRQADPNTLAQAAKIRELSRALTDAEAERCSEPYECWKDLRAEVTRLTEALAAAERSAGRADSERAACLERVGTLQKNAACQRDKRLAAEARVRELEAELEDSDGHLKALHDEFDRAEAQHTALVSRLCEEVDKAKNAFGQAELMARVEALETLLAASEARAAQWQANAEGYRADATVAQDRLAALQKRSAAEVSVLGAIDAASDEIVQAWVEMPAGIVGFYHDLGVAEKARRALRG